MWKGSSISHSINTIPYVCDPPIGVTSELYIGDHIYDVAIRGSGPLGITSGGSGSGPQGVSGPTGNWARRIGYIEFSRDMLRRVLNLPGDIQITWVLGAANRNTILIQLASTRFPWTVDGGEIPRYECGIVETGPEHYTMECDLPELDTDVN